MDLQLMHYRTAAGLRPVLVAEGRKLLHVIFQDSPVSVVKVAKTEQRYMQPLDYPYKKAVKLFRAYGRTHGITKSAKKLLRSV